MHNNNTTTTITNNNNYNNNHNYYYIIIIISPDVSRHMMMRVGKWSLFADERDACRTLKAPLSLCSVSEGEPSITFTSSGPDVMM